MSEDGVSDDRVGRGATSVKPPVRRSGRGIAVFATLLALVALGLAGYPHYLRIVGPGVVGSVEIEALRLAQQRQADELMRLTADASALGAQLTQQQVRIDAQLTSDSQSATAEAIGIPSPMPERALKLAEAAFLLQSAHDRMLVTRDTRAVLAMLLAAQSLVDQVDDASLAEVRTELGNEIASLRDVAAVDVEATFARLQAVLRALPDLPARGVRFVSTEPSASTDAVPVSTGTLAWQKFLSLFEFRRQGATVRPPIGPDEATYLRLNLGLMMQTAELALLRSDAITYQQSLEDVRRWLDDYLDTGSQNVAAVRAEIDQLLAVRLDRSPPDVGRSLSALRRVLTPPPPAVDVPSVQIHSSETP